VSHHRLFAVRAPVRASMVSESTVPLQVLMVSGPMASRPMASAETEKAAATPEAFASALVDLSKADLERLQAAKRQAAPAGLCSPAWPRDDGSDKLQATSSSTKQCFWNASTLGGLAIAANRGTLVSENAPRCFELLSGANNGTRRNKENQQDRSFTPRAERAIGKRAAAIRRVGVRH
jgi:hypothetical protein